MGGKMTPSAVLVIKEGHTRIINIKNQDGLTKLIDLVPDIDTGSIQMKDRIHVEKALKADRLQFADHIMIDPDYDGTFESRYIFNTGADSFSFISGGNFAAVVVDRFGREYPAEIIG